MSHRASEDPVVLRLEGISLTVRRPKNRLAWRLGPIGKVERKFSWAPIEIFYLQVVQAISMAWTNAPVWVVSAWSSAKMIMFSKTINFSGSIIFTCKWYIYSPQTHQKQFGRFSSGNRLNQVGTFKHVGVCVLFTGWPFLPWFSDANHRISEPSTVGSITKKYKK